MYCKSLLFLHLFWWQCYHFDFRKRMRFTCIFENYGEKRCKNWLENEFCILPRLEPFLPLWEHFWNWVSVQLNCTPDLTPRPKHIIQSTSRLQQKKSKELNCWKPGEAYWGWYHLRKHLYQLSRPCFCCADDSTSKLCSRILNFMFAKFVVKLIHRKPVPHIIRRKAETAHSSHWPQFAYVTEQCF